MKKLFRITRDLWSIIYKIRQLKKSLNYLQNALQIAHALNDINFELIILNNLATVYQKLGDVDTAIKYFEECINISEKTNLKKEIYIYYFNIGTIY
ncbi:MAG: tetratricopeptide repeat protein [Candidatus Marinimicrobia bacterium]|nr:tetratricopeptide repeat protein [Candidatus Neomarinimicrobiota bacterium]